MLNLKNRIRISVCVLLGLFLCSMFAYAGHSNYMDDKPDNINVVGSVIDNDGNPIVGASIIVLGTNTGISTDHNGHFELLVKEGSKLKFSFIGFKDVVRTAKSRMKIVMYEDSEFLNETVVVGYGSQKKVNLTGAVANVNVNKTLKNRPIINVANALQGVTPGVSVRNSMGGVGRSAGIKIRGSSGSLNATAGTSPLILVDNVPIPNLSMVNPDDIENISVLKDAASASIYGTRAAWGVILITTKQAKNNDKVRVTYSNNFAWKKPTKMPKQSKTYECAETILRAYRRDTPNGTSVSSIGYNVDDIAVEKMKEWEELYGHMSESELGELKEGRDFEKRNGKYFFYRSYDPVDMFLKEWSPQQKHTVAVSGGSDKTTFNVSLGYLTESGLLKVNNDKYDRYNLNARVNTKIRDWWSVHANIMLARTKQTEHYHFTRGQYDIWYYLLRWPAFYPYGTFEGKPFRSAITELQQGKKDRYTRNFGRANVGTEFRPIKDLRINFDYTFDLVNGYKKREGGEVWGYDFFNTKDPFHYTSLYSSVHNRAVDASSYFTRNTFKAYATYAKTFNADHNLKVMAGMDADEYNSHKHTSERRDLISFDKPEISLATGDQFVDYGNYHNDGATAGFFGRINYDYKGKYLLEMNLRYDGSSKFPKGDKWALFPSLSAGWRLSDETFMTWAKPVLTNLKLRGSWGTIGNQDVAANIFLSTMNTSPNSGWVINDKEVPFIGKPSVISPSLTWERVSTIDLGFDARFFNDEFGITFDWYQRLTTDMHSPGETLPSTFADSAPKINHGELRGRGIELTLDYRHEFENGLGLTASATFAKVREKITKYNNPNKNIYGIYEGKVLGEIWGYETDRLFQYNDFDESKDANGNIVYTLKEGIASQSKFETGGFIYGPGDVKFVDQNGDGVIDFGSNTLEDHGDLKRIGNTRPKFEYGFSLGLSYKGFDFYTFFQGVGRRNLWAVGQVGTPGFMPWEGWLDHQMDYWTPENTDAFFPRPTNQCWITNGRNFLRQTRYLLNMAYLRCKNITIGYTLPESLVKKLYLGSARVYVGGENLFEFDDLYIPIDPETTEDKGAFSFAKSYPFSRNISFGLQLTF